jgi:hypothetical protein
MNLKHVLLAPVFFLVFLYFYFPHFMPDSLNKDLNEMQKNIYTTPFGIQFNLRAKELCNRYPRKFLILQEIAVKEQMDRALSMKELHNTLHSYEIDLSGFNEVERMRIKKRVEDRLENKILRDVLIIEYFKNTLEAIRSHKRQLNEIFSDPTQHCEY